MSFQLFITQKQKVLFAKIVNFLNQQLIIFKKSPPPNKFNNYYK